MATRKFHNDMMVYKHMRYACRDNPRVATASIVSLLHKLMGEFHFRDLIKGRPCMCLEDNQGSVACINNGYANTVHLQAMQLASNLRQAVDEAPMEASYCNTENMSWFDKTSRLCNEWCDDMNTDLKKLGMVQWQEE